MQVKASYLFSLATSLAALTSASPDAAHPLDMRQAASLSLPFGTTPIALYSLPTDFPPPFVVDPISIEAIRNTLALYPFAIDGKNFAALSNVFTQNAVANYSAPLNVLTGLSSIESVLSASLATVTTQHKFGTQLIDILSPTTAFSVTYYEASHFGTGNLTGQLATAFGQYQDSWQRQKDGTWRIVYRNLVYQGALIGNLAVFQ